MDITNDVKLKRGHPNHTHKPPSSYMSFDAPYVGDKACKILRSIKDESSGSVAYMDLDQISLHQFLFIYFLDAQGKEQIDIIHGMMFQYPGTSTIFISLNIDHSDLEATSSIMFLDSAQCKSIARELNLLDPLGGGIYPLNYMMILDQTMTIRYQVPLKFDHCYGAYQKFGLRMPQLFGLVEEYALYANFQSTPQNEISPL